VTSFMDDPFRKCFNSHQFDDQFRVEDEREESFRSLLIRSGVILYGNQDKTALVSLFATPDQEPLTN